MKITKIERQVKQPDRYSIFVDDSFAFGLSTDALLSLGLVSGQELTGAELQKLKDDSEIDKLYGRLLGLLARRPRSEWEIQTYLKRKQVDEPTAHALMDRLRSRGMLNDADFAQRWIESRRLLKPMSKRKLALELRAKGLSSDVVSIAMLNDQATDGTVLQEEVARKRKQTRYQDDTKLMQYLARQGYAYDDIKRAMD